MVKSAMCRFIVLFPTKKQNLVTTDFIPIHPVDLLNNQKRIEIMKYSRLSNTELKELEKDFIQFLAANHVTADDWIKLKEKDSERVEDLIGVFSDIVYEKTLTKLEYLEFKTPHDIKTFHCQSDKMVLMGIAVAPESGVDFTKNDSPGEMIQILKKSEAEIQIYTAEKRYNGERETELFQMLQSGCLISKDGNLFKTLYQLKS